MWPTLLKLTGSGRVSGRGSKWQKSRVKGNLSPTGTDVAPFAPALNEAACSDRLQDSQPQLIRASRIPAGKQGWGGGVGNPGRQAERFRTHRSIFKTNKPLGGGGYSKGRQERL